MINRETGSNDIFAMLDAIGSDNESDIDNLLEDSDTEYVAEEPVPADNEDSHDVLTPEANIHIENTASSSTDPPRKKLKHATASLKWQRKPKLIKRKNCELEAKILLDLPVNPSPLRVFESTTRLNDLVSLICDQTNLYAEQNGRTFRTTPEEVRAFLGVNFMMAICKLPNIKCYWHADEYIGNEGIRNVLTRTRFLEILQNLHFADNNTSDTSDKGYKLRTVINHLNKAFQAAMSDADRQSIDEHMTKFKGRNSCKQYIKNKPIKWGFKWWCRCSSTTGYLYEFNLYLGKKEKTEIGLGESVVLNLSQKLEGSYCTLYFDNFFNSPLLVNKLYEKGLYCVGTVRKDRRNMAVMPNDSNMKRGDIEFQFSENIAAVKWFDNRGVTLVGTALEGCDQISSVSRRAKGQSSKVTVPCPKMVKDYNSNMGGVDLLDQKTAVYRLDRKSSGGRYYLRLFFDLMDMCMVNSHIVYKECYPTGMELLDFKVLVAKSLIASYNSRQRIAPPTRVSRRSFLPADVPLHLPIIQSTRGKCRYCYVSGTENKTSFQCNTCGVYLCLVAGRNSRNCFAAFHTDM